MQDFRTFRCLAEGLDRLGYEGNTANDVRRALVRAEKIYNEPLGAIRVDLDAFDARWRGKVSALEHGFRSRGGFEKWRSNVRGALKRALGLKALGDAGADDRRLADEWQQLKDYVAERSGNGRVFGPHREITLSILIERARLAGRSPHQLDPTWLREEYDALHNKRRKGFMRAAVFFNELVRHRGAHPNLGNLLPQAPCQLPRSQRGKQYAGAALPESLLADVEAFIEHYLWQGEEPLVRDHLEDAERSVQSASSYRSAISWLVREILEAGLMKPEEITSLSDICRYQLLRQVAGIFRTRALDEVSHLRRDATSLHTYVCRVSYIARHWVRVSAEEVERLKRLRKKKAIKNHRVGKMGEEREAFASALLDNLRIRSAVLGLPETTLREADVLLGHWDDLSLSARMRCLRLAVCACQAAILLRAMALRATNLRSITFRGKETTIVFKGEARKAGKISIPGRQVKNNRELGCPLPPDCEKIVRRFVEVYRPLLVTAHPYGKNASDSDFLFPGTLADRPVDASVFAHCFEIGIRAAGLDMTLHMCRHAIATLILYENPDRLVMVADWLGIDPATVRKHYGFLDSRRAAELGQQHMQKLIREARRRTPVRSRS
ncbi:site-specific integrase [Pelagibius litoralis]|uniref:Site-specific integrase n=1 Tax=Pelagibius litoralis TaxID=374515 RepID=A0A967EZN8_9PROT|nr:tyrosine-type recombinase/integrase [Pelagibius litoralis]NIA70356.1 site-specific integrase [Pelagibius litoralis]